MRSKTLLCVFLIPCLWLLTGCLRNSAVDQAAGNSRPDARPIDVEFGIKEQALTDTSRAKATPLKVVRRIQSDLGGKGGFVYPSSLAVSDKGGIYISDNNAHVIRYCPPDTDSIITQPVQQGAGKLSWPGRMAISGASLFVMDVDGLKIFKTDGKFQRLLRVFYQVNHLTISPHGTIYVNPSFSNLKPDNPLIVEMDSNGKRIRSFGARLNSDKAGLADEAHLCAAGRNVFAVFKHRPVIDIYSTDGRHIRHFNVSHPAFANLISLSQDEKLTNPEPGKHWLPKYISGARVIGDRLLILLDLPQPEVVEFSFEGQELNRYRADVSPGVKLYQDFEVQQAGSSYRFWILFGDGERFMALTEFIPSDEQ